MAYSLYFVRHGQTYLNRYNKIQGWCDSPLTPKGIEDGHQAGKRLAHLNFAHAFHSDTNRAARTCRYILEENVASAEELTPKALPDFREQNFGYFEGSDTSQAWLMIGADHGCRTFNDIITKYSIEKARDFTKEADPFHDAENNAEYWQRLDRGFAYLDQIANDGDKILLLRSTSPSVPRMVQLLALMLTITGRSNSPTSIGIKMTLNIKQKRSPKISRSFFILLIIVKIPFVKFVVLDTSSQV